METKHFESYPKSILNEDNSLLKWTVPRNIKIRHDVSKAKKDEKATEGKETLEESKGDKKKTHGAIKEGGGDMLDLLNLKRKMDDAMEEDVDSELQARLNDILPPRYWVEEGGEHWVQKVSPEPTTRLDVINLSQRIDNMMVKEFARRTGICYVRRRLHTQLFDEVIRQMTVINPPLGFLLLKVRDNLNMTMLCYRDLHDSGMMFGINKSVQAEKGRMEFEEIIEKLKADRARLEEEKKQALKSVVEKERRSYAERDLLEALHNKRMEHYEKTNKAFKELLDTIMISKV